MTSLPRLPPAIEHRILESCCGLPVGTGRRLFGPPPTIDGQTLASDVHAFVRLAAASGGGSLVAGMTVGEARRKALRATAAAAARPPLPMARCEELDIPGPAGHLPARLYVPALPDDDAAPLLVYFHGGGWVIGGLDTHDGVCRFLAAAAGIAVLSIGYRLAPEHPFPAAVEDALAGFLWAAESVGVLGADPSRIAIGGDSAGGNLAAVVSMLVRDAGEVAPAMQLLIYPATDVVGGHRSRELFREGFLLTEADIDRCEGHYLSTDGDRLDPRVSILRAPNLSGLPPAYVTTAGFDPLRDEGEAYAARMREAGVQVTLRRHPGLVHSFANQTGVNRSSRGAMLEVAAALREGLTQV